MSECGGMQTCQNSWLFHSCFNCVLVNDISEVGIWLFSGSNCDRKIGFYWNWVSLIPLPLEELKNCVLMRKIETKTVGFERSGSWKQILSWGENWSRTTKRIVQKIHSKKSPSQIHSGRQIFWKMLIVRWVNFPNFFMNLLVDFFVLNSQQNSNENRSACNVGQVPKKNFFATAANTFFNEKTICLMCYESVSLCAIYNFRLFPQQRDGVENCFQSSRKKIYLVLITSWESERMLKAAL